MTINATVYPDLPDDPEPGEYQCGLCGCRVTVGPSGNEYGHARSEHNVTDSNEEREAPCPRRDSSLNPAGSDGGASA